MRDFNLDLFEVMGLAAMVGSHATYMQEEFRHNGPTPRLESYYAGAQSALVKLSEQLALIGRDIEEQKRRGK